MEDLIKIEKTESQYKEVAAVLKILTHEKIMHQTTLGLDYLHGLEGGFIHRNIHGRNVLVAEIPSKSGPNYVVKLSDFRFGKQIYYITGDQHSNRYNSESGWIAPEMKDTKLGNVGPWTDVFILGCFFYYVLSGGHHPFGRNDDYPNRETNILADKPNWTQYTAKNNYKNMPEEAQEKLMAMVEKYLELMKRMMRFDASDRPTAGQILRHFDTKKYYDIYPAITAPFESPAATRPGLCVIFHQDQFDLVSTVPYPIQYNKVY